MESIDKVIKSRISESIKVKETILSDESVLNNLEQASIEILESLSHGKKLIFCGNGGSAADAQHLAAEFSGRFYIDRKALPAEALHVNTSYMTAVGNDYSFDLVYSRYLEGVGKEDDVLIGLSTSGNSKNIVEAAKMAKKLGMKVISLTGSSGGKLKEFSDIILKVPSDDTPRIQESHIMLGHIICEIVESKLFE